MITILFKLLFFVTPLLFLPFTSEFFELPKMYFIYFITCIIFLSWAIKSIRQKSIIFKRSTLDIPLIIFIGITLLATIFSIDPTTSLLGVYGRLNGGFISIIFFALLYWAFVSNINPKDTKSLVRIFVIAGVIVAVWALLERLGVSLGCIAITGRSNVNCWVQDVTIQSFATLGQSNWLGAYMTSSFPLAAVISPFLPVLFFIGLLVSGSKSALAGFVVGVCILIFLYKKQKIELIKIFAPLAIALAVFVIPFVKNTQISPSTLLVWEAAAKIIASHPIIGTGPETFSTSYFKVRPQEQNMQKDWDLTYDKIHNEYLHITTGTGIFGLVAYLLILGVVIKSFKAMPKDKMTILIFSGWIGIVVTHFFAFSTSTSQLAFYLFPAMLFAKGGNHIKQEKIRKRYLSAIFVSVGLIVFLMIIMLGAFTADIHFARGKKLARQDKPLEAISLYQKAINLAPLNAIYWDEAANIYLQIHSEESNQTANSYSQKALDLSPNNTNIIKSRILILSTLAKNDNDLNIDIQKLIDKFIKLAPTDPSAYLIAGIYYANTGDPNMAYQMLSKSIELKPDYKKARMALASLYINFGKNNEAKAELEKLLEYYPNDQYIKELMDSI